MHEKCIKTIYISVAKIDAKFRGVMCSLDYIPSMGFRALFVVVR